MGRANEFFGMEFNTAPPPTAEPVAEAKPTSLLGRAEAFFGKVFSSPPGSPRPEPKKAPVASVAQPDGNRAPKLNALEKDMAKEVLFTPQEEAARNADMKSPAFLKGLTDELAKAKHPAVIATLQEEIAKFKARK